jgi:hypothetical protein
MQALLQNLQEFSAAMLLLSVMGMRINCFEDGRRWQPFLRGLDTLLLDDGWTMKNEDNVPHEYCRL